MNDIDFSLCKRNMRTYGGANGSKIGIIYNDENYMLKFPYTLDGKAKGSYSNSCISEYVGCHIFESLGFEVQETLLGRFNDKIVVACKDFVTIDYHLADFASLKNSVIDSENNGYGTELSDILKTFDKQKQFEISPDELKAHFWDMFIADAFVGNFDRHNGNWGFLVNEKTNSVKLAPIFDCGSCLFPRNTTQEGFREGLTNEEIINKRLYVYPNSTIKIDNNKINTYNFLSQTDNKDCLNSLVKITNKINLSTIKNIIEKTPYISDLNKEFLYVTLCDRKEKILQKSIQNNQNLYDKKSIERVEGFINLCQKVGVSSLDLSYKKREIDFAYQSLAQNKIPKDLINKLESQGLTKDLLKGRHR